MPERPSRCWQFSTSWYTTSNIKHSYPRSLVSLVEAVHVGCPLVSGHAAPNGNARNAPLVELLLHQLQQGRPLGHHHAGNASHRQRHGQRSHHSQLTRPVESDTRLELLETEGACWYSQAVISDMAAVQFGINFNRKVIFLLSSVWTSCHQKGFWSGTDMQSHICGKTGRTKQLAKKKFGTDWQKEVLAQPTPSDKVCCQTKGHKIEQQQKRKRHDSQRGFLPAWRMTNCSKYLSLPYENQICWFKKSLAVTWFKPSTMMSTMKVKCKPRCFSANEKGRRQQLLSRCPYVLTSYPCCHHRQGPLSRAREELWSDREKGKSVEIM